jgi:hypothetical protein
MEMPMVATGIGDLAQDPKKNEHLQGVSKNGIIGAIKAASARTGVDFAYLVNKADQESGLDPKAKASTSSASGLYQFIGQTWLKMVKEHGAEYGLGKEAAAIESHGGKLSVDDKATRQKILNMRHDPVLSAAMAAEFTRDNKDYLEAKVGGNIGSTELYMAHFLGAGGAEKFLKAMKAHPNAAAANLFPQAADANEGVFYSKNGKALSLSQIYNRFAGKFKDGLSAEVQMAAADPLAGYATALPKRDMASMSADFYAPPTEDLAEWKRNGTTSDTLFNVMVMTQTSMKDALKADRDTRA